MGVTDASVSVIGGLVMIAVNVLGGTSGASGIACGFDNCKGFCAGFCPYRSNISQIGTQNMTVYRMTPYNVTDLVDHNSGDAAGDMGFFLERYLAGNNCTPPYNTHNCFLEDHTVVGAFDVQFDAQYGPYLHCNPNKIPGSIYLNMTDWICAYANVSPRDWRGACDPPCQRVNISVGKDPAHHRFWTPPQEESLLTYFKGWWYSTPRLGMCTASAVPGDGSGCTWRVRNTPRFINASCLVDRLFSTLESANPSCFHRCGPSRNATSPCFGKCVEQTVVGQPPGQAGISVSKMVQVWEEAFSTSGGCRQLAVQSVGRGSLQRE
eukprot:m.586512 g.586512  ORF g.586512 m.586512 type:complete len:322 (-) comp22345_c1_seq1:200-1165(-)